MRRFSKANTLMTGGVIIFNKDGSYSITAMNQTQKGTWKLSVDEKTITMDDGHTDTIDHLGKFQNKNWNKLYDSLS